ncbi:glycosyltransferase family 2 protein [Azospirillum halopraeferens]|uniref:glycosyltransferase family 2 protein n=1 Tax=Azospirillum halopraeferens TaxID=34010 RepID=UPI00040DB192|nr:glycosyltransferase family 2 protein [Azospirillum halopraeferens]
MAARPLVSIVTPTFLREAWLPRCHACVTAQTRTDIEWLVLDDSPEPSPYLSARQDERLRYLYTDRRVPLGEKRNILLEHARGEFIVHFDDDDLYAPGYVDMLVGWLEEGYDFAKLSGWFLYTAVHGRLGYWDTAQGGPHFRWARRSRSRVEQDAPATDDNLIGYGFSYAYRRRVWEAVRFPPLAALEDAPFAREARARFRFTARPDTTGLCLHVLHNRSTSLCLPQHELPVFLAERLFGERVRDYVAPQ